VHSAVHWWAGAPRPGCVGVVLVCPAGNQSLVHRPGPSCIPGFPGVDKEFDLAMEYLAPAYGEVRSQLVQAT